VGTVGNAPYLTVYYSTTASTAPLPPAFTIVSAAWAVALSAWTTPGAATSQAWAATRAGIAETTAWSTSGSFGLKVTSNGTGTASLPWGAVSPAFTVAPGSASTMQCSVYAPAALSAVSIGFTFWSGAGGTGTNLGSASGDQGALALGAGSVTLLTITGAVVPAGAVSATFFVQEAAADASGVSFSIDTVQVAGGLVYSLSPTGGIDAYGNPYPQGLQFTGLAGLTNVLSVVDYLGNLLAQIDGQGNISGAVIGAAQDLQVGGQSVPALIGQCSQGIIARGWTSTAGNWPTTPIGTSETAILELDQTLYAGRSYKLTLVPAKFIPTNAATQYVQQIKWTTDGTTPTTGSPVLVGSRITPCSNAGLNHVTMYTDYVFGNFTVDTNCRFLVTAYVQAGTFQYQSSLELRLEDLSDWTSQAISNNGSPIGSGTSGVAAKGTYVKTYVANATHSYYGATAANGRTKYGARNHGSTMWQSCEYSPQDRAFYEGDQYSFAIFPWSTIRSDTAGATINSVKVSLNCNYSWYSTGFTVIMGYTTYTGVFGSVFQPGGGTSENNTSFHINSGQTLVQDITSNIIATHLCGASPDATGLVFGPSASKDGYHNQNNYGSLAGLDGTAAQKPQLIINYTK
jgi:hypothetical protein